MVRFIDVSRLACLLLFSGCCELIAADNGEEIEIYLSTNATSTPIYLAEWTLSQEDVSREYQESLFAVLKNDFSRDGDSYLTPFSSDKEKEVREFIEHKIFDPKVWKGFGATFVITGRIEGTFLTLSVFSLKEKTLKHLPSVKLSSKLAVDRRIIHQLVDKMHQLIYGREGVSNSRILYCLQLPAKTGEKKWISEVWECDLDGSNGRQVTRDHSYSVTPVLLTGSSFTSDKFLYVSYKKGQPKIYLASLEEGVGKPLVSLRGNQLLPAVSRARDKIAFICDCAGRTDLFVQNIDPKTGRAEKPKQVYSYPRSTQASPTFSPDGSKIAFVSDKDGGMKIYLISLELPGLKRANAKLLTKKNSENSCPAWSPDGTKLAYSAKTKGVRQIWIYDFQTGEEWQLTGGSSHKENPVWAPDSLHLVFNSTGTAQSELYVVSLHQKEVIQITRGPGEKNYPAWGMR